MKKIKIVQISDSEFWGMGKNKGVSCIYLPLKEAVRRGYEVHYIVSTEDYQKKGIKKEKYEGINIYWFNIPLYPSKIKIKFFRILLVKLYTLVFVIKGTIVTYQIAKKIKPDIVYGSQTRGAIVSYFISKIFKVPNLSRFYGTFLCRLLTNPLEYLYMFDEVIAWKLSAKCYLITDDGTAGDKIAEKLGIPKNKINFWRDGVEDTFIPNFPKAEFKQEINIPDNTKVILNLSRLVRWKRVDRTIRAIPTIVKKRKDVIFLIVGDGPQRKKLEDLAKELNVWPYVKFIGAVERKDVKKFLNLADIFLSLSELSSLGNPVLEAMKGKKCIIGVDGGETRKVIKSGQNGFLIEPKDSIIQKELPAKILELLDNNELREEVGKAAFKYAKENFISPEEGAVREINLLENLVKEEKNYG